MKISTFENSVDVLVRAYMNDTLVHGKCSACAVGNLVCASRGTKPFKEPAGDRFSFVYLEDGYKVRWGDAFMTTINTSTDELYQRIDRDVLESPIVMQEIEATGYTWEQLALIEAAFEMAEGAPENRDGTNEQWMFNGLLAVVDVLAEIHNVDLSTKENAVGRFEEVHALKA